MSRSDASDAPTTSAMRLEPKRHLVAGTVAGGMATATLYPLDLVKTRLQVQQERRGIVSAMRNIVQREGVRGLYQGLGPALLGNTVTWGGYFFFYEAAKQRKLGSAAGPARQLSSLEHLAAAAEAGTAMVFISNPIWLIKTRLQLQQQGHSAAPSSLTRRPYRGMADALRTIVREEGPLALYHGVGPALLLVSHGALQFVTYEWMKRELSRRTASSAAARDAADAHGVISPMHGLVLGAASKVVASTATYPYQVVKARVQQRGGAVRYRGPWHCARHMWVHEGARAFFRGCFVNVLRVVPAAAVTFSTYEYTAGLLLRSRASEGRAE